MPSTEIAGAYFADQPHSGGLITILPGDLVFSSNFSIVRLAAGQWALQDTTNAAAQAAAPFDYGLFTRLLEYPDIQTLSPGLFGPVPAVAKGTQVNDIEVVYSVAGAALTSISVNLYQNIFANNTAIVQNAIPLNSVTLPTATQSNPYVIDIPVTTPQFFTTDLETIVLELVVTPGAGCTFDLYGFLLHCSFNFA